MIDPLQQTRDAAAAVAVGWASHQRLSDNPEVALNAVALDDNGSETRNLLGAARIHTSLLEGHRIILEGPAGCGKTTTLIQLAQIGGDSQSIPLLVDLPGWIMSGIDILERIVGNPAFRARGIDAGTLARVALEERCLFLLNGWNEISDLHLQNAASRLQALVRDFPKAGVIVATRTQRYAPRLPGSTRLRLLPLTLDQRFNYLEQALGTSQAHVLNSKLSGDRVLDALTRTALFLAEATSIFRSGRELPRTKVGLLGAAVAQIEQLETHGVLLQNPLWGRAENYLCSLATELTTRGEVVLAETEARAICRAVGETLWNDKQIGSVPDQTEILDALCAHHILETDYSGTNLRFQHQQFQEYYSALTLRAALAGAVAAESNDRAASVRKYINEPAWEDPLLMIAEEIGDANNDSASMEKLNAGKFLVRATLHVDPILAGQLARLCGPSAWKEVRAEVSDRLRSWYAAPNLHHRRCALAAMLATGSDDFADIIIPLLTDADQQVRDATYRAGPDFHPSSLGPEWQKIVARWAESSRIEFISELTLHKGRSEVALVFARSDPSLTVRIEAMRGLAWMGQSRDVAELLQALPDEDFRQTIQKLETEDIPRPIRSRAISDYKSILAETNNPKTRFQITLRLAELGEENTPTRLKDELINLPPAIVQELSDYSLRSAVEIVRGADRQWVSQWVADRIVAGTLWRDSWLSLVSGIPGSFCTQLLLRVCTEDLPRSNRGPIISLLAATATAAFSNAAFGALRSHRQRSAAGSEGEVEHAIDAQLINLLRAISPPVVVEGLSDIFAGEPVPEELSIITEILRDIEPKFGDLRCVLPEHPRQQLRRYLKTAVSVLIADKDRSGRAKAQLAMLLSEVGEFDDTADLLKLIGADIERLRRHRASQQRHEGMQVTGNIANYAGSHVQALARLGQAQSESALIDLLREPEYEVDAAWSLREIAKGQPGNRSVERRFGWPQRDYSALRNSPSEWSTIFNEGRRVKCATAITRRISELREESRSGNQTTIPYDRRLKELAKVLAEVDPVHSVGLILEIAAIPGRHDGFLRAALLEGLLFGGAVLPAELILGIVHPVVDELRTQGIHNDNAGLLRRLLCILPFVQPGEGGFSCLRELVTEFRLAPHRDLLMAFSQSACDEGLSLLQQFAELNSPAFQQSAKDWIEAVAACSLPRAKSLLLSLIDPEASAGFISVTISDDAANVLASRISDVAKADATVTERILHLCSQSLVPQQRMIISKIVARLDTPGALLVGLDLIDDSSPQPVPYELRRAIEEVFVEKRAHEEIPEHYIPVPRSATGVRKRLLEMLENDARRARSAYDLLGQIEVWRLEYGRPSSEPRHPAYESGKPWPPLPPDHGKAVGSEIEHASVESEPVSREDRLQAFLAAHPGTTLADVKYSANVHTTDFQKWRKDQLDQASVMSGRIEDVLSGHSLLQKRPRKSSAD